MAKTIKEVYDEVPVPEPEETEEVTVEEPDPAKDVPEGYAPLSIKQRQDWNSFVRYLNTQAKVGDKVAGGNPELDKRDKRIGLDLLSSYAKSHPGFEITEEMVPHVQYEIQQLKNNNTLPGLTPSPNVKTLISDYFTDRQVSTPDGWIGSLTSREGYPIITEFEGDPNKTFWNLDYQGASKYDTEHFASK